MAYTDKDIAHYRDQVAEAEAAFVSYMKLWQESGLKSSGEARAHSLEKRLREKRAVLRQALTHRKRNKSKKMAKKSKKKPKRSGRRAAKRTTTRTVTTKTTVTRNGKLKWRHIGSGHEALRGGNWYLVERLGSEWEVYFAQKGSENPRVISVQSSLAKGRASAERHAARQAMKSRNFCGSTGDDRCRGAQWMGIGRNKSKTRNCGIRNTKFWGN